MATANEIHIKSEDLLQQLGIWRLIAAGYSDLFNKNAFLQEFLAFKMDIAEGFIEELHSWEEIGNETKCKNATDNVEFFLGQIQVLIDRMFADQTQETWQDIQQEGIFSYYIYASSVDV